MTRVFKIQQLSTGIIINCRRGRSFNVVDDVASDAVNNRDFLFAQICDEKWCQNNWWWVMNWHYYYCYCCC